MNGEARILQSELAIDTPTVEKHLIFEQKAAAMVDSTTILPKKDTVKREDRFIRLKRHLRKRSASIL